MPNGFFRGLVKVAADEYNRAKAQQQYNQQQTFAQAGGGAQKYQTDGQYTPQPDYPQQEPPPTPPRPYNSTPHGQQTPQYFPPPPTQQPNHANDASANTFNSKNSYIQTQEIPPTPPLAPPANSTCTPMETIPGGKGYCIYSIPDMDICPTCFYKHIASTPFAQHFRPITYPPNSSNRTCDLAILSTRNAWLDTCARAGPQPSPGDLQAWLPNFSKQHAAINTELAQLIPQVQALDQEIQILHLQQQYQRKSAMIQISHGVTQNSIASMNILGTSSSHINNPGSPSISAGNVRFAEAGQMVVNVGMKEMQLKQVVARMKVIVGVD